MSPALYWIIVALGVIGFLVMSVGIYCQVRDNRRRRITGHWVEHRHLHYGRVVPWVQPVTSGTAAQSVVELCDRFGFKCTAEAEEVFNVAPRHSRTEAGTDNR